MKVLKSRPEWDSRRWKDIGWSTAVVTDRVVLARGDISGSCHVESSD